MVLASHVVITAYGFWLPNDPRGSWSDFVRNWELLQFGPATKVSTRRSLARAPHDAALRAAAKQALRYPVVRFSGEQAALIGTAFARRAGLSGYVILACSILSRHIHLVIARHHFHVEQVVN